MQNQSKLKPTLWRTCRAMANRRRLELLQYLIRQKDSVCVTEVAGEFKMSLPTASQHLRILNARGLLKAQRRSRFVTYRVGDDPTIPETRALLDALKRNLGQRKQSVEIVFKALTGFTHARRIALMRVVAEGADRVEDIRRKSGISRQAAMRHLKKLVSRGYLEKSAHRYHVGRPKGLLARSLLGLVLSEE